MIILSPNAAKLRKLQANLAGEIIPKQRKMSDLLVCH